MRKMLVCKKIRQIRQLQAGVTFVMPVLAQRRPVLFKCKENRHL